MEAALDELGIELTTPLVAFRLFNWSGKREHYSHKPDSYNRIIEILWRQFDIICEVISLIDYMKRCNKSSGSILRRYTQKHLMHLHKFARIKKKKTQPEINAFEKVRSRMLTHIILSSLENMIKYNTVVDALWKAGMLGDALEILEFMKSKGSTKWTRRVLWNFAI